MGVIESVAGEDESEEEDRPKKDRPGKSEKKGWHKGRGRRQDSSTGTQSQPWEKYHTRPPEVSERVWGLAEQWLAMGEAHFGERVPVSKQGFAKRLATKIHEDPNLTTWLQRGPGYWNRFGKRWDDGYDFVNDVLAKMLDLFWSHLTDGQKASSAVQWSFLEDEWDEWVYQAVTAVQVAWLKKHSTWDRPSLPTAVFDRASVGRPEDDDPCTDPEFAGMTWGQVRALREEDSRDLGTLPDDAIIEAEEIEIRRRITTFARLKDVMLANREPATKETNDQSGT